MTSGELKDRTKKFAVRIIKKEANELVAIMLASRKTAKKHDRALNRKSTIENRQLAASRSGTA